ncbi:hypothetical protein DFH06DRAFT_1209348 [Mycena polygramma]|nr:hypothetical protein DFH06DRAFT_1209348 [Mycena polygramma]
MAHRSQWVRLDGEKSCPVAWPSKSRLSLYFAARSSCLGRSACSQTTRQSIDRDIPFIGERRGGPAGAGLSRAAGRRTVHIHANEKRQDVAPRPLARSRICAHTLRARPAPMKLAFRSTPQQQTALAERRCVQLLTPPQKKCRKVEGPVGALGSTFRHTLPGSLAVPSIVAGRTISPASRW